MVCFLFLCVVHEWWLIADSYSNSVGFAFLPFVLYSDAEKSKRWVKVFLIKNLFSYVWCSQTRTLVVSCRLLCCVWLVKKNRESLFKFYLLNESSVDQSEHVFELFSATRYCTLFSLKKIHHYWLVLQGLNGLVNYTGASREASSRHSHCGESHWEEQFINLFRPWRRSWVLYFSCAKLSDFVNCVRCGSRNLHILYVSTSHAQGEGTHSMEFLTYHFMLIYIVFNNIVNN